MTRLHLIALPIATALLLSACSGGNDSESSAAAQNRSSSAGLPKGRVEQGEALAHTKGEATGQSCIDCHGADGNLPLDPSYPKLGGQYRDYLAQSLRFPGRFAAALSAARRSPGGRLSGWPSPLIPAAVR